MSRFGVIPATVFDANLKPSQIALLALLSTYADKTGYCWPSYETLAKKLHRSKAWVSKQIHDLQEQGFLEISRRKYHKYGFKIIYDEVPVTEHEVQQAELEVQPAEQNSTKNNLKYSFVRKTQIPNDFEPTQEMKDYLLKNRPDLDLTTFTRDFITQCKAKGYLYKRWDMAWQNWVNKSEINFNGKQTRKTGKRPSLRDIEEALTTASNMAAG